MSLYLPGRPLWITQNMPSSSGTTSNDGRAPDDPAGDFALFGAALLLLSLLVSLAVIGLQKAQRRMTRGRRSQ